MTPLPEQEVNPLIPDGIENFVPKCVVCTNPVPPKRATSRSKDTCSPECHKVLRAYRKHLTNSRYCPACYHPSSPEERRDFISWRKHRGDRAQKPGRPRKKKNPETEFYVMTTTGDGAQSCIVPGSKLEDAVHEELCSCGYLWPNCTTEGVLEIVRELQDEANWSNHFPTYNRYQWGHKFEDGSIEVTRLTDLEYIKLEDETE